MVRELFDVAEGEGTDEASADVVVRAHLQPGAGRTAIVGRHGDALKVRVAVPPETARANEACAALLADVAGVAASAVELVSGTSSRAKRFRLAGVDVADLEARLALALEEATGGARGRGSVPKSPGTR